MAAQNKRLLDATGCGTTDELQVCPPPLLPLVPAGVHHCRFSSPTCPLPVLRSPQDLLSCLLLSEAVYKAAEGPPAAAAAALNALRSELPPGLAPLLSVQYSRRSAEHRCGQLWLQWRGAGIMMTAVCVCMLWHQRVWLAC